MSHVGDCIVSQVDDQVRIGDAFLVGGNSRLFYLEASQDSTDAGYQFLGIKWFDHVVISTKLQTKNLVKGFAADDAEVDSMMERLARLYQENGKIDESNFVYNQLIAANPGKFKIVGYQHEIMLNTETLSNPTALAEDIQRTVAIFVKARDEKYEGATPEAVKAENDKLSTLELGALYYLLNFRISGSSVKYINKVL